ncbi:MAG: hypothetical protein WEB60_13935 [Terrimicrobiaceae bacterium]
MVAVILLGLFGLVQLMAVARHYLPLLRAQLVEVEERKDEQPPEADRPVIPAAQASPEPALIAQAAQIVAEADRNFRVGDFEATLRSLKQAEQILPTDPAIQFRIGQVYEALDDKTQAFVGFERSIAVPGLPVEIRRQAEQKMALLAQVLGGMPGETATLGTGLGAPAIPQGASGEPVRDAIGLQPGSVLGVVDARLQDSQPGGKTLRIAVKSKPDTAIDPQLMNVHVFFYEQEESGEVVVTEAKSTTQWISPPVDWADSEPELLDVEYPLPDGGLPGNSAEYGALNRKYYGYVVGVYYNGELQDSRAAPGRLDTLHPLPLQLKNSTNE